MTIPTVKKLSAAGIAVALLAGACASAPAPTPQIVYVTVTPAPTASPKPTPEIVYIPTPSRDCLKALDSAYDLIDLQLEWLLALLEGKADAASRLGAQHPEAFDAYMAADDACRTDPAS